MIALINRNRLSIRVLFIPKFGFIILAFLLVSESAPYALPNQGLRKPLVFEKSDDKGQNIFPSDLKQYLLDKNKGHEDAVERIESIWKTNKEILLELGCGNAEIALKIAINNKNLGVIATDLYESRGAGIDLLEYGLYAVRWKNRELSGQKNPLLPNLAIARVDINILQEIPDGSLDYILVVNSDDDVMWELFSQIPLIQNKLKYGGQFIIKPYLKFSGFDHPKSKSEAILNILKNLQEKLLSSGIQEADNFSSLKITVVRDTKVLGADLHLDSDWQKGGNEELVGIFTNLDFLRDVRGTAGDL